MFSCDVMKHGHLGRDSEVRQKVHYQISANSQNVLLLFLKKKLNCADIVFNELFSLMMSYHTVLAPIVFSFHLSSFASFFLLFLTSTLYVWPSVLQSSCPKWPSLRTQSAQLLFKTFIIHHRFVKASGEMIETMTFEAMQQLPAQSGKTLLGSDTH